MLYFLQIYSIWMRYTNTFSRVVHFVLNFAFDDVLNSICLFE